MGSKREKHRQLHGWRLKNQAEEMVRAKNLCRSLIPLDTRRIEEEFKRKCQDARKDFENAQKLLSFYDKQEKPAYGSWLLLNIGPEMEEFKRLQGEIFRKKLILRELEYRGSVMQKTDRPDIFHQLMMEMDSGIKNPFTHLDDDFPDWDLEGFAEDIEPDDDDIFCDDVMHEDFEDDPDGFDLEDFIGDEENMLREVFGKIDGGHGGKAESKREDPLKDRIRDLYRTICKKLHPDTGADFNARNSGLWHEAQEAYEYGNIKRLEAVLAMCELETGSLKTTITCSQMMEIIYHYREGIDSIRDIIHYECSHEEEWGFLSWDGKKRKRKLEKLRKLMKRELVSSKEDLKCIELRIIHWKIGGKVKKASLPPCPRDQMDFGF